MADHRTEERLRDALHAYADAVEPREDWADVVERLDGRGRRPWAYVTKNPLSIAAIAAAVAVVVALVVGSVGDGDSSDGGYVAEGPGAGDEAAVAVLDDLSVVLLDGSGEVTHTILTVEELVAHEPAAVVEELAAPSEAVFDPLGRRLFMPVFLRLGDVACPVGQSSVDARLLEITVDGTVTTRSLSGRHPAVAQGGTHLAHLTTDTGSCGSLRISIVDLVSGATVNAIALPEGSTVESLDWMTDGQLVVSLALGGGAAIPSMGVWVVDDPLTASSVPATSPLFSLGGLARVAAGPGGDVFIAGHTPSTAPWAERFEQEGITQPELTELSVWAGPVAGEVPELLFTLPVGWSDGQALAVRGTRTDLWVTVGRAAPAWPPGGFEAVELFHFDGGEVRRVSDGVVMAAPAAGLPAVPDVPEPPLTATSVPAGDGREVLQPRDWHDLHGFVGITASGEVIQHSLFGGEAATIADIGPFVPGLGTSLAFAPDASALYVSRPVASCDAELLRVDYPTTGELPVAAVELVARGASPAVSPDGRALAYVELSAPAGGNIQCTATIVVRDLVSGDERRWIDPQTTGDAVAGWFPIPNSLVWASDSRTLVFNETYESSEVWTFDTSLAEGTLAAERLDVGLPGNGEHWQVVSLLDSGEVALRAACYADCEWRTNTVAGADPATGSVDTAIAEVPTVSWGTAVAGDGLTAWFAPDDGSSSPDPLLWWSGSGHPERMSLDQAVVVAWVPRGAS